MKIALSATEIEQRYHGAVGIAREAGAIAVRYFRGLKDIHIEVKGLQDYVTDADTKVEAFIRDSLHRAFPHDGYLGEETGRSQGDGDGIWIVDPIDGTGNFLRRIPFFCVSIAFAVGHETEIGVVFDPVADELFAARRGFGAKLNEQPIKASTCSELSKAVIGLGSSYRTSSEPYLEVTKRLFEAQSDSRRLGSAALGLSYVACGRLDGFWELHLNAWDVVAGHLLVREVGAWANEYLNDDSLRVGGPILACPQGLAPSLKKITGIR